MRSLDISKIPKPNFDFEAFKKWRNPNLELAIEIGCGVGRHPIQWARANPDRQILAIERTSEKFEKCQRRLAQNRFKHPDQYNNIYLAHAEAAVLLPHLIESNQVTTYFYLYPNPEPKSKNRRLSQSPLLPFIQSTLCRRGQLIVASNVYSYIAELTQAAISIGFSIDREGPLSQEMKPRTHFEKKYLERGDSCFELVLSKMPDSAS